MRPIAAAFSAFTLLANPIAANAVTVKPAPNVNLERYLGKWHEIARMPMAFQWGCKNSVAEYKMIGKDKISVTNSCDRLGMKVVARGDAIVEGPGKLGVSFSNFMPRRANYWVLYVDPAYKYAVVGEPRSRYGWILSRSGKLSKTQTSKALNVLKENGYNTSRLIWNGAE